MILILDPVHNCYLAAQCVQSQANNHQNGFIKQQDELICDRQIRSEIHPVWHHHLVGNLRPQSEILGTVGGSDLSFLNISRRLFRKR